MTNRRIVASWLVLSTLGLAPALAAQQPAKAAPKTPAKTPARTTAKRTVQAQSTSSMTYRVGADGQESAEIQNVAYDITGTGVPGRPAGERLLLRKTVRSKAILGDIGTEATVALDAWPVGTDPRRMPLYSLSETGTDGRTLNGELFVVDRRLEEVEWWSVHRLGDGQRLFDTYVPLVSFSISRETVTTRYVGLDVPADDEKDARLREAHVVAVLAYASPERVIREALITCDDPTQAQLLRSYFDSTRAVSENEGAPRGRRGKAAEPSRTLKVTISQNYPSPPGTIEIVIPISGDDLDLAHARLPGRLHVTSWTR